MFIPYRYPPARGTTNCIDIKVLQYNGPTQKSGPAAIVHIRPEACVSCSCRIGLQGVPSCTWGTWSAE